MYAKEALDAVFLCVGPKLHPDLAIEALDNGVHVWMEKPPALRANEIDRIIGHRKDMVVVVGFKKAFMPAVDKVIEILSIEPYKQLKSMLAVYPMSIPLNGEEVLRDGTMTNWLGNGCHPLSLMIAVCGSPRAVTTVLSKDGAGACLVEFKSGVIGTFHLADGASQSQPQERYEFFTSAGAIKIENSSRVTLDRGIPFDYNNITSFAPPGFDHGALVWEAQNTLGTLENKALFIQGIVPEMRYFCDCIINNNKAVRGSLEFAREVMSVYEAGLISHGKRILISSE
jgi:predicted dehydrogenase